MSICLLERADHVTILRRRGEPCVGPAGDTGGCRAYQAERPTRSICGTMYLEAALVGRVIMPGDIDPAVGHRDRVGVRWRIQLGGRQCVDRRPDALQRNNHYERGDGRKDRTEYAYAVHDHPPWHTCDPSTGATCTLAT